ncbi:MAG: hypothetical protein QXO16_01735 [Archaeoglobaceae archaeon]
MLEEINYWKASSWKEFVRSNLVPLRDLGNYLGYELDFLFYPNELADEALHIGHVAEKAVEVAEKVFGEPMGEREISEEEDVFELIREFLEIGANTTAGCSKHTFFVWSTRKITKNYLEEHYPALRDPETFNEIAKVLGWSEYWRPPKSKFLENYRLYSYPDYLTLLNIHKEDSDGFYFWVSSSGDEKTLGGLICKLNEDFWWLFSEQPELVAEYSVPDVFENYQEMCEDMLDRVDWSDDYDFISASRLEDPKELYGELYFNELYDFERMVVSRFRRSGNEYQPKDYLYVFQFWDILMPPMFLGKYELVFTKDKSRGVILARW